MSNSPARILVLGGGVDAALTTAVLARTLRRSGMEIICVRDDGVAAAQRALRLDTGILHLHALLGFSEADFMRNCDGIFSLGVRYAAPERGTTFVLSDAGYGTSFGQVPFHTSYGRGEPDTGWPQFDRFCLAAQLGKAAKFGHPGDFPPEIGGQFSYGYIVDRARYADYLFRAAAHYGARIEAARSTSPGGAEEAGDDAVDTDYGPTDLVIDAASRRPADGRADLTGRFILNTASAPADVSTLSDVVLAQGEYCELQSTRTSGEALTVSFQATAEGIERDLYSSEPWRGRALAMGESAFGLLPLEAAASRILTAGLLELLALLPAGGEIAAERAEYNRRMRKHHDRIRDLQMLHLHLSGSCAGALDDGLSEENRRRIEQFSARGRIVTYDFDPLGRDAFAAILYGYGLHPNTVPLAAMSRSIDALRTNMVRYAAAIDQAVSASPTIEQCLERIHAQTNPV